MKSLPARLLALLRDPTSAPPPSEVLRTTAAAVGSLLLAELFRLPNPYWAAISCLIVVLSSAGSELAVSVQRCFGTALGAGLAAGSQHFLAAGPACFGLTVLTLGLACCLGRIHRGAFRYGSIAAAIVILVPRTDSAALVALHRFIEVSLGIAAGLATALVWPLPRPTAPSRPVPLA
jgi:uncharacterized membrane protein YgaE (UPF0421/DUF939 family)